MGNGKIRVLVVDDSAVMRKLIPGLLARDGDIEVVATAVDGDFAVAKVEQLRPDVVTLDVEMPRMDGLTALKQIVSRYSVPVLMLSSFTTRGAELTMKALELGAVDFICKPKGAARAPEIADELIGKVRAAARSKIVNMNGGRAPMTSSGFRKKRLKVPLPGSVRRIVAIGASSGGPHALRYLLPRLPIDFGAGVVVVQHMPESFTAMMARWLDEISDLEVREACHGDIVLPGRVLIAPGNAHLTVKRGPLGPEAILSDGGHVNGHRPSVDVLFNAVAKEYGRDAIGVILTGMGSDGAAGIGQIKRVGGHTVAQDRESSAIFGMPRVAIERGCIDSVIALADIAGHLVESVGRISGTEVRGNGTTTR